MSSEKNIYGLSEGVFKACEFLGLKFPAALDGEHVPSDYFGDDLDLDFEKLRTAVIWDVDNFRAFSVTSAERLCKKARVFFDKNFKLIKVATQRINPIAAKKFIEITIGLRLVVQQFVIGRGVAKNPRFIAVVLRPELGASCKRLFIKFQVEVIVIECAVFTVDEQQEVAEKNIQIGFALTERLLSRKLFDKKLVNLFELIAVPNHCGAQLFQIKIQIVTEIIGRHVFAVKRGGEFQAKEFTRLENAFGQAVNIFL